MIYLWLLELHVCWILSWIHRSSELCLFSLSLSLVCAVINIRRCSPISFKHAPLWCLLFDPHRTIYQSNLGGPIKENKPLKTHLPTEGSLHYQVEYHVRLKKKFKKKLLVSSISRTGQNFINCFSWVGIHGIYYILKMGNQI